MVIRNDIPLKWLLFYNWKSLVTLTLISVLAVLIKKFPHITLDIPISITAMLSGALSIYLGFRSNNAYDRWWEARQIWGAMINYSRAWGRQVETFLYASNGSSDEELIKIKKELVYRHIAFVHALRVFLRGSQSFAHEQTKEIFTTRNDIEEIKPFVSAEEFELIKSTKNPPNVLLHIQGQRLAEASKMGLLSDYRFIHMDQTLVEFNNIQGRSERIKNTAFPRAYSYFQRVFVWTHGIIIPFAYVSYVDWMVIPIAFVLNYVFFAIDFVSSRTEDPFENRWDDIPLSAISRTVEINLRETLGEKELPPKFEVVEGVLF
jgi:ion channel-forming bestrophin family protein